MIILFFALITMALVCATGSLIRQSIMQSNNSGFELDIMLQETHSAAVTTSYGMNILTFSILFNSLIPLSLIVTMEFVKFSLASMIDNDIDMYYEVNDIPAQG
jgi:phospholipid-transporting ATPase